MKDQIFSSISKEELKDFFKKTINDEVKSIISKQKQTTELLTIKEAHEFLRISRVTLDNWRRKGIVKGVKLGSRVLFVKSDLLKIVTHK
jgi:excisionase family DNA binding protein